MRFKTTTLTWCCLLASVPALGESTLAEIRDLEPGEVAVVGFELDRSQPVRIEARGLEMRKTEDVRKRVTAAWILDAGDRGVVWEMDDSNRSGGRQAFQDHRQELRLEAGTYEVYYATIPKPRHDHRDERWWQTAGRSIAKMFGWGEDEPAFEKALADLGLTVRGEGRPLDRAEVESRRARLRDGALLSFEADQDDFSAERGFVLDRPAEVEIYAVGELTGESGWDYGGIVDAETRERVWTFRFDGSEPAGGAEKNRQVRATVSLPAGRYGAFFVTDDSHSPGDWNTLPPRDPAFWGMTLEIRDPEARRYARLIEFSEGPEREQALVELTRLQNDDTRSRGLEVREPVKVRVYAVGEGQPSFGMVDFGWIADARSREHVWTMELERTEHAGGALKNRVADEVLELAPGRYVIGFVTDDSHAYREWNSAPPARPEAWGIALYAVGESGRDAVASYPVDEDPAILAQITQVRSDSYRSKDFRLDKPARVWVYALGEGLEGEMYDYGWLEDDAGHVVWKMAYPETDGAGGASKNRLYRGPLDLAPGRYTLHYRTDDSHAFRDWNDSPPADPEAWGVQVALVDPR